MAAPEIYVAANKATLIGVLEAALREIRHTTEGGISVPIYANPTDGTITFTDEDGAEDGVVLIEVDLL